MHWTSCSSMEPRMSNLNKYKYWYQVCVWVCVQRNLPSIPLEWCHSQPLNHILATLFQQIHSVHVDVIHDVWQTGQHGRRMRWSQVIHAGRFEPSILVHAVTFRYEWVAKMNRMRWSFRASQFLTLIDRADPIVSANNKDHVIDDFDAEIASRCAHLTYRWPIVRCRIVSLAKTVFVHEKIIFEDRSIDLTRFAGEWHRWNLRLRRHILCARCKPDPIVVTSSHWFVSMCRVRRHTIRLPQRKTHYFTIFMMNFN